jgi:hypothetical protein
MTKFGFLFVLAMALWPPPAAAQDSSVFDWVAFHRANDQSWAQRTGLPPKDVRKLRLAAGVADDEPSNPIDAIDAKTLPRGRILFVTAAGSGHCLNVSVFHRRGRSFEELWSESETPEGGGFCHPSLCRDATTWATRKNQVIVVVPVNLEGAPMGVCDENVILTYKGAGRNFVLAETKHLAAQCGLDDYQRALHMAFAEPEGSVSPALDRLVTIHIFPSFRPESAIAFEKTENGLAISRLAFSQQAWKQLAIFTRRQTPSQCIAAAKSIPIERTQVNISRGDAQRLLDDLKKIDLQTDSCPRLADGSCAHIFDGETFTIILEDGRLLRLTNVEGIKGVRSQNPALSHWVTGLRAFVKVREQPSHN